MHQSTFRVRTLAWAASLGLLTGTGAVLAAAPGDDAKPPSLEKSLTYPAAERTDHVDDYHGAKVSDPYRWLEDPDSPQSRTWIEAQNVLTREWLDAVPQQKPIEARLTHLWNYERFGPPTQRGGKYFFTRNDGLQNQSVLYWAKDLLAPPSVLLDPNTLSADGTVSLSGSSLSDDGNWLAYGLAAAGSDWQEWRIREVATGKDLDDHLEWVKFSGASWTPDGQGFYYSRYDAPTPGAALTETNYFQKLYYHRRGTPQSEDRLVYHRPDQKEWMFGGQVTEDGRYLVIQVDRSTEEKNLVFYQDLTDPNAGVQPLIEEFEYKSLFLANDGPVWYFLTDDGAPRNRIVSIDVRSPARDKRKEVVPEAVDLLEEATVVGERFLTSYLHDASNQVRTFDMQGQPLTDVPLPGLGTAAGFTGRRQDRESFFAFTSFTSPTTIYRLDLDSNETSVFKAPDVDFQPADYETAQIFLKSKDGTRVPMFLVHRKGIKLDGTNPTLLYAYGGFNISIKPAFAVSWVVWLEMGGVLAVPNLRGGGEFGRDWHEAGMREKKQNVFDDFIAAAEWLIEHNYTSPAKLAIHGRSNGGLLVGAALTQRPELFGAVLPRVGVLDMLRYHKFTIGWAWVGEYGSADESADFPFLYKYSPLHRVQSGTKYPATLITTGDHDDRVVPGHSFKFAAALQAAQAGSSPILIRIDTSAGHGAGKPTSKIIAEEADGYAFLVRALKMDVD